MTATASSQELPKQYDHAAAQRKWYPFWEQQGYFHAEPDPKRKPYTIVIPPPNVTGALHLGHALNNTLQDILIRWRRMQGYNALWMPGTDHAGIATQAVVERRLLEEEKLSRHDLGREGLVERIWQWKEEYEKRIIGQLKQLGSSCDWARTRFTLDDQCARAVRETFFRLFKDDKIYRGKRMVNWDTYLQTAVSDDEVFHEPVKGHFWHFRYPVVEKDRKPGEPEFVTIATTRPETMLGDTAVAVHPDPAAAFDKVSTELREKMLAAPAKEKGELEEQAKLLLERRAAMLPTLETLRDMARRGVKLELPLTGREIPLIADEWAKPELGSGCVKITPAHDENDHAVWQRHQAIGAINIMNPDGTLNDNVPEKYRGLTMKKARSAVVADLEAAGLYNPETDREDREIDLAHSDRSKTPIEPYLADQWFVKMDELAQSAMDAVTSGRVKIIPERYGKSYLDWLSEKRDWPVGRQLWWGHRIPVWRVTLQADLYEKECGSFESSLERVDKEFHGALDSFADACGLAGHFAIEEISSTSYFLCARSEEAEHQLEDFRNRRHNHAHVSALYAADKFVARQLREDDPRAPADSTLRRLIAIMSDREEEVLDTWFSSALWPHSTLGWPEKTPELEYFYPTSTLVTSRDIITLWVARMVLTGLYNVGEVPFREVFIHPKILDGYGETMSKSKGNGVDPLDVIEKFGADALRFGLAYLTTETQDARMPVEFECPHCQKLVEQTKKNRTLPRIDCPHCRRPFSTQWARTDEDQQLPRAVVVSERFELGRNFCNKMWNAARFTLLNLEGYTPGPVADEELAVEDRWLLSRLATVTATVTGAWEQYRYADAARTLYDFAWDEFCSFYVEMVKARLEQPEARPAAQRVLAHALDMLLRLLHPMVPFLTEEVWQRLAAAAPRRGLQEIKPAAASIMIAPWPEADTARQDAQIEERFAQFQRVLGGLREVRSRHGIAPRDELEFAVRCQRPTADLLQPMEPYFQSMARARSVAWGPDVAPFENSASFSLAGLDVFVDMKEFIDVEAELEKLSKQADKLAGLIAGKEKQLANKSFVERAPAHVVQQQRDALAQHRQELAAVQERLAKL